MCLVKQMFTSLFLIHNLHYVNTGNLAAGAGMNKKQIVYNQKFFSSSTAPYKQFFIWSRDCFQCSVLQRCT